MSPKKKQRGRPKKIATAINRSEESEVFVLPPQLLQKLGINLSAIQHNPGPFTASPPDDRRKSKRLGSKKPDVLKNSDIISKSRNISGKPQNVTPNTESSMLETADLMKTSVFLSPTFIPPITPANIIDTEIEVSCLPRFPETILNINLPEEMHANNTDNDPDSNIEELEKIYEAQNAVIHSNKEKSEFSKYWTPVPGYEGDISREIKGEMNTSSQQIDLNPAEPSKMVSAKYTNNPTGLLPVCDASSPEIMESMKKIDIRSSISESVMPKDDFKIISTKSLMKTVEPVENVCDSYNKDVNTAQKNCSQNRNEDLVTVIKERQNETVISSADTINKSSKEKCFLSNAKNIVLENLIYEQKQSVAASLDLHSDKILKSVNPFENDDIINISDKYIVSNASSEDHLDEAYLSDCSSSNLGVSGNSELRLDNKPKVNILSEEIIEPKRFTEIIKNAKFSPKRDNLVPVSVNTMITLHCDEKNHKQRLENQIKSNQSTLAEENKYESSEHLTNNNNVVTNNNPNQNISVVTNSYHIPVIEIQPLSRNSFNSSLVPERDSVEDQSNSRYNTENSEGIVLRNVKNDENNLESVIEQFKIINNMNTTLINNDEILIEYLDESNLKSASLFTSHPNFIWPNYTRNDGLNDFGQFVTNDGDDTASKNKLLSPTNLQAFSQRTTIENDKLINNSKELAIETPCLIPNSLIKTDDTSDVNNKNVYCYPSDLNVLSASISEIKTDQNDYKRYESSASEINDFNEKRASETVVVTTIKNNVIYKQLSDYQEDEKSTETSNGMHLEAHDAVEAIEPDYRVQHSTIGNRNDNKVTSVNNEIEGNKQKIVKDTCTKLTETSDGMHLVAHDGVKAIEHHYNAQYSTVGDRNDNKVTYINNKIEGNKEKSVKDTIDNSCLKPNIKSKSLNQNHKVDSEKSHKELLNIISVSPIIKDESSNTNHGNLNYISFRPSIDSTSTSATYQDDEERYKYIKINDRIKNKVINSNKQVRVLDDNKIYSSDQITASCEKNIDNKEQENSYKAYDKVAEIASYLEKCAHILTKRRKSIMSPKYADGNRSPKYVNQNVYKSNLNAEGVEKPGGLEKQEEDDTKVRNAGNHNFKTYKRSSKFPRPIKLYCDKPITDDEVNKITLSTNSTLGLVGTEEYCLCGDFGSIAPYGSNEELYQHVHFENKSIGYCCVDIIIEQNYEEYIECQINTTDFNVTKEPNEETFESICWNSVKDKNSKSHGVNLNFNKMVIFENVFLNNVDNRRRLKVQNSEKSATVSKYIDVYVPKLEEKESITINSKLLNNEEKSQAGPVEENNHFGSKCYMHKKTLDPVADYNNRTENRFSLNNNEQYVEAIEKDDAIINFDEESKKDAVSTCKQSYVKNKLSASSSIGEEENSKKINSHVNTNLDKCYLNHKNQNITEIDTEANEVNLNADTDQDNKKTGIDDQRPQAVKSTVELDTRKISAINHPQTDILSEDNKKLVTIKDVNAKFKDTPRRSKRQSSIQNNSDCANYLEKTKAVILSPTQHKRSETDLEQSYGNIFDKNPDGRAMSGIAEQKVSDVQNEDIEQIDGSEVTIMTIVPDENDKMYNEECALTITKQKQASRNDGQCNSKSRKSCTPPTKEIKSLNSLATSTSKMIRSGSSNANTSQYNVATEVENSIEVVENSPDSKKIKCGVCQRGIGVKQWTEHISKEHCFISWKADESIDLKNEELLCNLKAKVKSGEKLICTFCKSDVKTSKKFLAHVQKCLEKHKSGLNKNIEINGEAVPVPNKPARPIISSLCAVCHEVVDDTLWFQHIEEKHNYLAWKDGETPVDFNQREDVRRHLGSLLDRYGYLNCPKCEGSWTALRAFRKHVKICSIESREPSPVDLHTDVSLQEHNPESKRKSESGIKAKKLRKSKVTSEPIQNVEEAPNNIEIESESQSETGANEGSRRKRGRPPKQKADTTDSSRVTESDPERILKDDESIESREPSPVELHTDVENNRKSERKSESGIKAKELRKSKVASEPIQNLEEAPKNMEIESELQSKTGVNEGSRRKRGRPPKQKADTTDSSRVTESDPERILRDDEERRKSIVSSEPNQNVEEGPKNTEIEPQSQSKTGVNEGSRRKRGRPPKQKADTTDVSKNTDSDAELILKDKSSRKRGRQSKIGQDADGDDASWISASDLGNKSRSEDHQSSSLDINDASQTPTTFKKKIKTEQEENSIETMVKAPNPSVVECGVCQKQVESMGWLTHIQNEHRYLAWRSDETPVDLEDVESVQDHLMALSRRHNGLTCSKCGSNRKYPKAYLSHVETCQAMVTPDTSNISLNDTMLETYEVLSTKSEVTCAICSDEMKSADWEKHTLKKHYNLAWPVGAKPIDLKAPYVVERYLKTYKSKMKAMVCTKCGASRASCMGFYAHVLTCGKTEEELEDFKDVCEICKQKYLCIYKQQHYAIHKVQEDNKERKRLAEEEAIKVKDKPKANASVQNVSDQKDFGPRKAAEKARTVLENYTSAFQCKYSCPDCDFSTDNDKMIQSHKCKRNDPQINDDEVEDVSELGAVESEESAVDSDISAEVDEVELARVKRKMHKKYYSVRTQLHVPYPVRDSKKFVRGGASDFLELNYTADTVFDGWKNIELVPVADDCLPQYLPEIEESCKVKMDGDWSTYKRFEARKDLKGYSFFIGGSPQCIAWSPPRYKTDDCDKDNNYLAISCHRGSDGPRLAFDELHSGPNTLQIWNFELFGDIVPKLVLGLAHDWGTIWSMDWCPSGTRDPLPETNDGTPARLGLLAVACSNGAAYILSVPNPSTLPVIDKLFYKPKPVVELRLYLEQKSCQATSIAWSKQKGHAMVVVGYSNGITAMYDLICDSPLTRSMENGVTIIHPYHDERIHATAVTGVSLFAGMDPAADTGLVGTSSPTGVTLSARGSALAARVSIHNAVKDVRFLPQWPSLMLADDPITNTELDWLGPSRRLGTVRACAGCERCGLLLTSTAPLVRVVIKAHKVYKEAYKRNLIYLDMAPLAQKRTKQKSNDKFEMTVEPFTYEKAIEKYGIDVRFLTPKDTVSQDVMDPRPERYPLADVTTIAFCPTPEFHHRAAVATHAGVVLVVSV